MCVKVCGFFVCFFSPPPWQAGDLFKRTSNNQRALDSYRKGNAFKKGEPLFTLKQ